MMEMKKRDRGFTLIEIAISIGILGALTVIVAALFMRSMDTYGQVMSDTESIKQARQCMSTISRETRESLTYDAADPTEDEAGELATARDALLLTSARQEDGAFVSDRPPFGAGPSYTYDPTASSLILFYVDTTDDGISHLYRHQLFFASDLSGHGYDMSSFTLLQPNPYADHNIVIVDGAGTQIPINMITGMIVGGGTPATVPKVLMNRVASFDVIAGATNFLEARVTCQNVDRFGRTATSRLRTQLDLRNNS